MSARNWIIVFLLALLGVASQVYGATVPTTGFVTATNCANVVNPAAFQTFCGQTTAAGGRVAGGYYVYNGSAWITPPNTGGAPTDATYITQTPNSSLSAEQALSGLSAG